MSRLTTGSDPGLPCDKRDNGCTQFNGGLTKMNQQTPPIKEPLFSTLLDWTLTNSPFQRQDFTQSWPPDGVLGPESDEQDPTIHSKLLDTFRQIGWLMEDQAGKLYHSSDPLCKRQNVRLITCISKVRQIMAMIFQHIETSVSLEMKILEESAFSVEKIQLMSHLKRETDFQFEMITHLATTLQHIAITFKTLDEENVNAIESFLLNFWGTPPSTPEPTPETKSPTNGGPRETETTTENVTIQEPIATKAPGTNHFPNTTNHDHPSPTIEELPLDPKKSDQPEITEDELNDRYQSIMRTHQIDFSQPPPVSRYTGGVPEQRSLGSFRQANPYGHIDRNFMQHSGSPTGYLSPGHLPPSLYPTPTNNHPPNNPQGAAQNSPTSPHGFRLPSTTQHPTRSFF